MTDPHYRVHNIGYSGAIVSQSEATGSVGAFSRISRRSASAGTFGQDADPSPDKTGTPDAL
jgi:hypothetical protein